MLTRGDTITARKENIAQRKKHKRKALVDV